MGWYIFSSFISKMAVFKCHLPWWEHNKYISARARLTQQQRIMVNVCSLVTSAGGKQHLLLKNIEFQWGYCCCCCWTIIITFITITTTTNTDCHHLHKLDIAQHAKIRITIRNHTEKRGWTQGAWSTSVQFRFFFDYLHCLWLYTSFPLYFRGMYCTFYHTTFTAVVTLYLLVRYDELIKYSTLLKIKPAFSSVSFSFSFSCDPLHTVHSCGSFPF